MFKSKLFSIPIILVLVLTLIGPTFIVVARPLAAHAPLLGLADSFSVLAYSGVTDANPAATTIAGDVGVSPTTGTSITIACSSMLGGAAIYTVDAAGPICRLVDPVLLGNAQSANTAAYGELVAGDNAPAGCISIPVELGGYSYGPGVYCADHFTLNGTLTLTGTTGPWIFQALSTLTTVSAAAQVVGGDPCNVWWRLPMDGTGAAIGSGSHMIGNILAYGAITMGAGAELNGRAFSQTSNVTLIGNRIFGPTCATTTGTTLSSSSISAGSTAFDTATLSGTNSSTAGGTVTYNVYSDAGCTNLAQSSGPLGVVGGSIPNSSSLSFPSAGTFYWRAAYSGDTNNAASASACGAEVLTVVAATAPVVLPTTGFAPNRMTVLPAQPADKAYSVMGDLWLEIPRLGVKMNIVGVPPTNGKWDVSWLGNDAGWLQGSAFPTWAGNSVLTGHVWNADNTAGPFSKINTLWWGDKIIVHAWGAQYVYEVRSVKLVSPTNTAAMMKHEELPWVTLVTCRGYDEASNSYKYRVLVRAVLLDVK